MLPYLTNQAFGNPSSSHRFGRAARAGIEQARREVAQAIGAEPNQVIFTSGGTEADNLGIIGAALASRDRGGSLCAVVSAIEHKAVLAAAHAVCHLGGPRGRAPGGPAGPRGSRGARRGAAGASRRGLDHVGEQRGGNRAAGRGHRAALPRHRRGLSHRRGPGLRQGSRLHERAALYPAHPFRAQDRRPQGHRGAGRPRPQGGGGDHPRGRSAVRHPARHRKRSRRCGTWVGPRSWPPGSRPRRRSVSEG